MQPIITLLHISAKLQSIFEGIFNTQGGLTLHEVETFLKTVVFKFTT